MPVLKFRLAPSLLALLLGCTALCGCAATSVLTGDSTKDDRTTLAKQITKEPAGDLDGSVRQAQLLRVSGDTDGAVRILSQLMMVASDDPRVVSEYGKTLAQAGRAQDAVQFLTRAQQLSPNDWMVYSALGVAYDQLGNQADAQKTYEHALALKPGEPSVLNNYALSRLLANDPQGAGKLADRARIAGGDGDPKIARNLAMIAALQPQTPAPQNLAYAVQKPAPAAMSNGAPGKSIAAALPQHTAPQPQLAVATANAAPRGLAPITIPQPPPPALQPRVAPPQVAANVAHSTAMPEANLHDAAMRPAGIGAPRPLMPPDAMPNTTATPNTAIIAAMPAAPSVVQGRVVMQAVPLDPLAGPVMLHPTPAMAAKARKEAEHLASAKPDPKPAAKTDSKAAAPQPVKTAANQSSANQSSANQADSLEARAEAIAKGLNNKPAAIAQARADALNGKAAPAAKPQMADAKPAAKSTAVANKTPAKDAAKDKPADKNAVPALRMTASAY